MPKKRSSDLRARELAEQVLNQLRELARSQGQISMSDEAFWDLCRGHYAALANLAAVVEEEVAEEKRASTATRECIVCNAPLVKRHKKGRWPIYCDEHSLSDR